MRKGENKMIQIIFKASFCCSCYLNWRVDEIPVVVFTESMGVGGGGGVDIPKSNKRFLLS